MPWGRRNMCLAAVVVAGLPMWRMHAGQNHWWGISFIYLPIFTLCRCCCLLKHFASFTAPRHDLHLLNFHSNVLSSLNIRGFKYFCQHVFSETQLWSSLWHCLAGSFLPSPPPSQNLVSSHLSGAGNR